MIQFNRLDVCRVYWVKFKYQIHEVAICVTRVISVSTLENKCQLTFPRKQAKKTKRFVTVVQKERYVAVVIVSLQIVLFHGINDGAMYI